MKQEKNFLIKLIDKIIKNNYYLTNSLINLLKKYEESQEKEEEFSINNFRRENYALIIKALSEKDDSSVREDLKKLENSIVNILHKYNKSNEYKASELEYARLELLDLLKLLFSTLAYEIPSKNNYSYDLKSYEYNGNIDNRIPDYQKYYSEY